MKMSCENFGKCTLPVQICARKCPGYKKSSSASGSKLADANVGEQKQAVPARGRSKE
ncbi:hypothetical protein [Methanosarcina virus MetMV]|jgi:hypothetical protein|nr:hypothetical protein [Methanosarcina virus MetMV]